MYNILICDDERDIVSALRIYLSAEGYRIFEAHTGKEALDIVAGHEIHLILMDIFVPAFFRNNYFEYPFSCRRPVFQIYTLVLSLHVQALLSKQNFRSFPLSSMLTNMHVYAHPHFLAIKYIPYINFAMHVLLYLHNFLPLLHI